MCHESARFIAKIHDQTKYWQINMCIHGNDLQYPKNVVDGKATTDFERDDTIIQIEVLLTGR